MNITRQDIKDDVIKNFLANNNQGTAKIKVIKNSVIGYSGCGSCYGEASRFSLGDTITICEIKKSENSNSYFGKVYCVMSSKEGFSYLETKERWISLSSSNIQFIEYEKPYNKIGKYNF
jgi:hypothetical protein